MEKQTSQNHEKKNPSKRKRRWLRRLLALFLFFLFFLWAVNGPIARGLVAHYVNDYLEQQGMSGQLNVKGTVLSGLVINRAQYSGEEGLKHIELDRLEVDYKISEIIRGEIRGFEADHVSLVIDTAKFTHNKSSKNKSEASSEKSILEQLDKLRSFIKAPEINLSDIKVTILKSGKKTAVFELAKLKHQAESADFHFTGFQASDAESLKTPRQDFVIAWGEHQARLDNLELLPEVVFLNVRFGWLDELQFSTDLRLEEAEFSLSINDTITCQLKSGEFRSDFIQRKFNYTLPVSFVVSMLNAQLDDWQKAPSQMNFQAELGVESFFYKDYQLINSELVISQKESQYDARLTSSINEANINMELQWEWIKPKSDNWWSSFSIEYNFQASEFDKLVNEAMQIPPWIDIKMSSLSAAGKISLYDNKLLSVTAAGNTKGSRLAGAKIPPIFYETEYQPEKKITAQVKLDQPDKPSVKADWEYFFPQERYQGSIVVNEPEISWINTIAQHFQMPVLLSGRPLLEWSGSGSFDFVKPQVGKLSIERMTFKPRSNQSVQFETNLEYNYPSSIRINDLSAKQGEWLAEVVASWDGKIIQINKGELLRNEDLIVEAEGSFPFDQSVTDVTSFFNQKQPWEIAMVSKPLAIKTIGDWFQIDLLSPILGEIGAKVNIAGSPQKPVLNGSLSIEGVQDLDPTQEQPFNAELSFKTEKERLFFSIAVQEGDAEKLNGDLSLPFESGLFFNDPNHLNEWLDSAELQGQLEVDTLPLARFSKLLPQLEEIEGTVDVSAQISGSIAQPKYKLKAAVEAPLLRLENDLYSEIKDIDIQVNIDDAMQAVGDISASSNGGKFKLSGKADLTKLTDPSFDVNFVTRYALAYRDDVISSRLNSNINIKGTIDEAVVSGDIAVVESLIYKEIELIPIGLPSSAVGKVRLPSFNTPQAKGDTIDVPEIFQNWKLNLKARIQDPILIRGNVAKGRIVGAVDIGGTLANPRPQGTLVAENVRAKLPFSMLTIPRGEIRFRPEKPFSPMLNIRGNSNIGNYDINVFVYGNSSSPQTRFTSNPPLPESEILTLLATGTTSAGLGQGEVAAFKAIQVLLLEIEQRQERTGGNELFISLLEAIKKLNLNAGEENRFTGRQYASATVELGRNWNLTAQFDAGQESRGLVVYMIRFR